MGGGGRELTIKVTVLENTADLAEWQRQRDLAFTHAAAGLWQLQERMHWIDKTIDYAIHTMTEMEGYGQEQYPNGTLQAASFARGVARQAHYSRVRLEEISGMVHEAQKTLATLTGGQG